MRTNTMPVIATCHVTAETDRLLQDQGDANPWTIVAPYSEGAFIFIQAEDMPGQPADLGDIFAWARKGGHEWVQLDAAGDHLDELPVYEW